MDTIYDIIKIATNNHKISKQNIINMLSFPIPTDPLTFPLFVTADKTREKHVGNKVHLRALIEFTNHCKQNCLYCGLRRDNKNIIRYRMTPEEIIDHALNTFKGGFETIVLQGGEDPFYNTETLCKIIQSIRTIFPSEINHAITLSIGELSTVAYKKLREAGVNRFLLRIETTNRLLYEKLSPCMDFDNRIRCLKDLKTYKYEVGTGNLIGLPEQTIESIAEDILFFNEINSDMVGIGPFITNPDTPLKDHPSGDFWLVMKVLAITRLLLPNANIPATTSMETKHKNGRMIALQCGANVAMPNVTNPIYKENYKLYPKEHEANSFECIKTMLEKMGRVGM